MQIIKALFYSFLYSDRPTTVAVQLLSTTIGGVISLHYLFRW